MFAGAISSCRMAIIADRVYRTRFVFSYVQQTGRANSLFSLCPYISFPPQPTPHLLWSPDADFFHRYFTVVISLSLFFCFSFFLLFASLWWPYVMPQLRVTSFFRSHPPLCTLDGSPVYTRAMCTLCIPTCIEHATRIIGPGRCNDVTHHYGGGITN